MNPAVDQAYALADQGRLADALAIIEPWVKLPNPDHATLAAYAVVLKRCGRLEEALEVCQTAARRFPDSGVAWHNLATALKDSHRDEEAAAASDRALQTGLDAPEAWLVWARAHQSLNELDKAEHGFREAVKRRPDDAHAVRDLAQLVWMRTEDADAAVAEFETGGWTPTMAVQKAGIYKFADRFDKALEVIEEALPRANNDPGLLQAAVQHALDVGKFDRALVYAEYLLKRTPQDPVTVETWAVANLAMGKTEEALHAARQSVGMDPGRQSGLAVLATCARAAGAAEYEALYNYGDFVRPGTIAAPKGWSTVEAYLADLKAALVDIHVLKTHPLDQSLRHGSQTTRDLRHYDHPAIQAFFPAIEPLVRNYMDAVGEGDDPLRRRNTRGYGLAGAWSVRLRPCGFHVDHIHPEGWLSSAFYVETPDSALESAEHEGWIKFGVPGLALPEKPEPGHFERPAPGKLVLFPSYMWHGTVPFTTAESRMTIAFDIVPAQPPSAG